MNFEGKCAIKFVHGLPKLEPVTQRVIKGHQIVVCGCNLNLLTIKQGYQIIHKKIVTFFIMLYLSNNNTRGGRGGGGRRSRRRGRWRRLHKKLNETEISTGKSPLLSQLKCYIYMEIIRAGDIELNLSDIKNPCSVCGKPVARTHRALDCSKCQLSPKPFRI